MAGYCTNPTYGTKASFKTTSDMVKGSSGSRTRAVTKDNIRKTKEKEKALCAGQITMWVFTYARIGYITLKLELIWLFLISIPHYDALTLICQISIYQVIIMWHKTICFNKDLHRTMVWRRDKWLWRIFLEDRIRQFFLFSCSTPLQRFLGERQKNWNWLVLILYIPHIIIFF